MTETNIIKDSDGRLTKCLYERNGYLVAKLYGTETKECMMKYLQREESNHQEIYKMIYHHYDEIGCNGSCDGFDSTRECYIL